MKSRNNIINDYIENVAQQNNISVEECRHEIEAAILIASKKPTKDFIKMFGNQTPSLEEFIYKISESIADKKYTK